MTDERTILFADVSGSTRIIETAGDTEGHAFIELIVDELSRITGLFRGTVIKKIGDEVMSSFDEPIDAIVAAVEMQRVVQGLEPLGLVKPKIKVGIHWGPVIVEGEDIFGDVVNVAARVVAMAKRDQILTTAETLAAVGGSPIPTRSLGEHSVRGRGEPLQLREVLWEENREHLTALAPPKRLIAEARLELHLQGRVMVMSGTGGELQSLGRGEGNGLVVADTSASRSHADIVARGGRFYLADHSTNGTYVRPLGGDELFVHRDEALLRGVGAIRLGRAFSDPEGPTLEYRIT
jgi:class 3 adenylate cyclase